MADLDTYMTLKLVHHKLVKCAVAACKADAGVDYRLDTPVLGTALTLYFCEACYGRMRIAHPAMYEPVSNEVAN